MLEYWNDEMASFGQNLAPLRSAIGILEDWKFFKTVLIIPYKREKFLRFDLSFQYSIIPLFRVGRKRMVRW
jgi:hypothetical protein